MPDQKTIDLIGQEVHTPNHAQIYEKKKQCEKLDKEINKFKKQHQKIFDKLSILQLKSDNLCERWTNKWDIVNEYEEKFIVRDTREIAVA